MMGQKLRDKPRYVVIKSVVKSTLSILETHIWALNDLWKTLLMIEDIPRKYCTKITAQGTPNFYNGPKMMQKTPVCRHSKSFQIHTNGPRDLNLGLRWSLNSPHDAKIEDVPRTFCQKESLKGLKLWYAENYSSQLYIGLFI